ncbi:MAG: hypothetical protein WBW70_17235 [Candidatus Sulfotelmatobacter sp.]
MKIVLQPAFADRKIAEKQAAWLEKVLADGTSARRNTQTGSNYPTDLREQIFHPKREPKQSVRSWTEARILSLVYRLPSDSLKGS